MADYDPLHDLSELFVAVLNYRTDSHEYAGRIASRLGLGEDDSPGVVHGVLAKALGIAPAPGDSPETRIARALVRRSISDYEVPDGRVIEIYESAIGAAVREGLAEGGDPR